MNPLDKIRRRIDAADDAILKALALRRKLSRRITLAKERKNLPLRDAAREEALLSRLILAGRKRGLDAHLVTRVFQEIIDDSVRSQQLSVLGRANKEGPGAKRVGFQGIEGAYGHLAAGRFFSGSAEPVVLSGFPTLEAVVDALKRGAVDCAFLHVENTVAGSQSEVYDLVSKKNLFIVGEEVFPIEHCLLGFSGTPLSSIKRVYSHPLAIGECSKFFSRLPDCRPEYMTDTALAVRKVKEDGDPAQAAVASREAGLLHGLDVLRRGIADDPASYTRFLAIAAKPIDVDPRIRAKTSLAFEAPHEEGSLLRALGVLHKHRINLAKLESRPRLGAPFEYVFYLDIDGNKNDPNVGRAIEELRGATSFLRVLGTYPAHARARTAPKIRALIPEKARGRAVPRAAEPAPRASYRLASRQAKDRDTVVEVRGVKIGGPGFVLMAGPCAVESREQIFACARQVKECGGDILRGGCFKPRTSPYSFQGLGYEALDMLHEAGRQYDLPIVTEVLSPADIEAVARKADIIQIGARNMQNFSLLKEAGRINRPVMLKRGMSATLDEFLNAAEYILGHGNQQVILCERGIRTFETMTRNTLDLGAIPILKRLTHLPVIVDPSHAAGQRDLVIPLALAARAVEPAGLIVEIHPDPEKALSDGAQSLRFKEFSGLVQKIYAGKNQRTAASTAFMAPSRRRRMGPA